MARNSIKIILSLILLFSISSCCKYFCDPEIVYKTKEVLIPVYSCPVPKEINKPNLPNVVYSSPLNEKNIVGLDETNFKNNAILYMNLITYIKALETTIQFYKDNGSNQKEEKKDN